MNGISRVVRVTLPIAACGLLLTFASGASPQRSSKSETKDVYVCACMKTASCACASMSNKAGKCPCGDEMKDVARNSKWANTNRGELSK